MRFVLAALLIVVTGGVAGAQDPGVGVEVFSVVALIDHPDSFGVRAMHLNDKGEVAGRFKTGLRCDAPEVSFVWGNGVFHYVAVPDAYTTRAEGVNERGAVTGSYIADPIVWDEERQDCAATGVFRQGFIMSPDGRYETLPWDALHSVVNNLTPNGWMTGPIAFCDWRQIGPGCLYGYLYNGSDWRLLEPPGCDFTDAIDVNTRGDVVGYCSSVSSPNRGFRFSGGRYQFIDFPGATETSLWGTNNAGDIVGSAEIPGGGGPFVLRQGRFSFIQLADYEWAWVVAWDINDAGTISGYLLDADGRQKGFLARPLRPAGGEPR